ncbi:nucleoside triphosphate pyrophosphohydrolase [Bacillus marinisedimentorum]|uniref:nucleoside triphosphate pyrophosphohydrolase n=1 Tax=Bacillus marinisedimentorum TaxID=1821260 RepID=UPI00087231B9|nr:nucleoside triphosphate pyrophosphohydrolase [Bacillus marinisedimentorum]
MIIYNKLVRDKIPEIIEEQGKIQSSKVLDQKDYYQMLEQKLLEEVQEFLDANNKEKTDEMADILEVFYTILEVRGVSLEEVEKKRRDKKSQRGGFEKRILLESVTE